MEWCAVESMESVGAGSYGVRSVVIGWVLHALGRKDQPQSKSRASLRPIEKVEVGVSFHIKST